KNLVTACDCQRKLVSWACDGQRKLVTACDCQKELVSWAFDCQKELVSWVCDYLLEVSLRTTSISTRFKLSRRAALVQSSFASSPRPRRRSRMDWMADSTREGMFGKSLPKTTRSWNSSTRWMGGGLPRYLLKTIGASINT